MQLNGGKKVIGKKHRVIFKVKLVKGLPGKSDGTKARVNRKKTDTFSYAKLNSEVSAGISWMENTAHTWKMIFYCFLP